MHESGYYHAGRIDRWPDERHKKASRKSRRMTVAELRKKLEGMDDKTWVVILRETDTEMSLYEVGDVALHRGTPRRHEATGKALFTTSMDGPATWLFIEALEA
jgi:hypothetical protein